MDWHRMNVPETRVRAEGEDMLIVIYPLDPNYIREGYIDPNERSKDGKRFGKRVPVRVAYA